MPGNRRYIEITINPVIYVNDVLKERVLEGAPVIEDYTRAQRLE
jgi:hypothetical protein